MADLASISERRVERLVNPSLSGDLPAFLVRDGGLNSGLMMIHVTAAALVSEAKANAFPASVDSIPTSAGKEDHVSMGPIAARKLARNVDLYETVLAIELLAAGQALDLRRPLVSSPPARGPAPASCARACRSGNATARRRRRSRGRGPLSAASERSSRRSADPQPSERVRERGRQLVRRRRALEERPRGEDGEAGRKREGPAPLLGHAVEEKPGSHAAGGEAGRDLGRRPEGRGVGRRGDEEAALREEARRLGAARPEAVVEAVERAEEVREVREEAEPEDLVRRAEDGGAAARGARERLAEEAVRAEEETQGVVLEELDETRRRREEVEAPRRGRRVEDDEVDLRVGRVLVQRFDSHVLEDAGQRVHEARVEAVRVDAPERLRARDAREEALERGLRVDLEGAEAPAARQARHAHRDGLAAPRIGGVETERLREAAGRVHGQDERPPPAPRRGEPDGGRERRLPDAAGARQDDQLLSVEPGAEVEVRLVRGEEERRGRGRGRFAERVPSGGAAGALRAGGSRGLGRLKIFFEGG